MKTKIPLWINILQVVILAILSFQTYACYFNPPSFRRALYWTTYPSNWGSIRLAD